MQLHIRGVLAYRQGDAKTACSLFAAVQEWADRLGVDRSELLRDAVRRQLNRLASDNDALTWQRQPLDDGERALSAIADWGPAEDWTDWAHAAR